MKLRTLTVAGLLAILGLTFTPDKASAQISVTPGGVQIGGSTGAGIVVPYGGGGVTLTSPSGAYNTQTGAVYAPAYSTQYGTTYYNPSTGGYYNPTISSTETTTSYYYPSGTTYYGTPSTSYYYPSNSYYYQNRGWRRR